jgi:hypothetical protein
MVTTVQSGLTGLQTSVTGLTTTMTTDFTSLSASTSAGFTSLGGSLANLQTSVGGISTQLTALQASITNLGHAAQATSGSGETTLSPTASTVTVFTSSNNKIGAVTVTIGATATSHHDGTVTVRYYTDSSNPSLYFEQTVDTNSHNPQGYTGTASAWKVQIVDTFPNHPDSSDTVTLNWAFTSITPP